MRLTGALLIILTICGTALAEMPELIPREVLFGNPEKDSPKISPDGTLISYLAPSKQGVMNVWVKTSGKNDDRMVTSDEKQGIHLYYWAYNGKHILYFQDQFGDENDHLFAIDLLSSTVKDLTPFKGSKAQGLLMDQDFPDEVLVGINLRDPAVFDLHRIDLKTGKSKLDTQNPGDVIGWTTDHSFDVRAATAFSPDDASTILRVRDAADKPWRELIRWPFKDGHQLGQINGGRMAVSFTPEGNHLYIVSSLNSPTLRLEKVPLRTREAIRVIAENPKADIDIYQAEDGTHHAAVEMVYKKGHLDAVLYQYGKPQYHFLNPQFEKDIKLLQEKHSGFPYVESTDLSKTKWIVQFESDDSAAAYYLFDRNKNEIELLFEDNPALKKYQLAKMEPIEYKSRDGLTITGFLVLPPGLPPKNLPLVISPHGGPWYSDVWLYDPEAQWLANRGYAVLKVNFRGSIGFGKAFLNAASGEWGGKMQNDITDGVKWAIAEGTADPKRVAIFGGSYGGYATLAGVTFTPEVYACAIDLVGPSNVKTLMESIPPYWKPVKKRWMLRIGDVENDAAFNRKISPLFHVDKIRVPLLIAHGANDPRVKLRESEQIVKEMRDRKLQVTFVVYPDEGHGFKRPENMFDFYGRAEEFLQNCVGGRVEPWKEVKGSSAELR